MIYFHSGDSHFRPITVVVSPDASRPTPDRHRGTARPERGSHWLVKTSSSSAAANQRLGSPFRALGRAQNKNDGLKPSQKKSRRFFWRERVETRPISASETRPGPGKTIMTSSRANESLRRPPPPRPQKRASWQPGRLEAALKTSSRLVGRAANERRGPLTLMVELVQVVGFVAQRIGVAGAAVVVAGAVDGVVAGVLVDVFEQRRRRRRRFVAPTASEVAAAAVQTHPRQVHVHRIAGLSTTSTSSASTSTSSSSTSSSSTSTTPRENENESITGLLVATHHNATHTSKTNLTEPNLT